MSQSNKACIPINNMYSLPAKHLFVYLSNSKEKTKCNKVIYNGVKPPIKTTDADNMLTKLNQLFNNSKQRKKIKKYFKIFLSIQDELAWIDSHNWDYPGNTAEIKHKNKSYLDFTMIKFISFANCIHNPPKYLYSNQKPNAAMIGALFGMGNDSHGQQMISSADEWNMDHILSRCIEIFAQMQKRQNCKSRPIYPDPIYRIHGNEARGKHKQWRLGKNFENTDDPLGILNDICYMGDSNLFENHLLRYFGGNVDFNSLFLGEIEFPLLFFIMSGHRDLMRKASTFKHSLSFEPAHLKIAQYMIDHGLDVNIQNIFGYTVLQEAVINHPDVKFARFLLKNGADPNLYNIFCGTALHGASMQINVECVKLLCEYGGNPLLYDFQGYRALDIQSARNHIEIYTILCNQARKIKENRSVLEYEDASYCFVCKKSNKCSKLYRCAKCISAERYCSIKCQKIDWLRHKVVCNHNRMRVKQNQRSLGKQLTFFVQYCGENDIMPMWKCQNQISEYHKNEINGPVIAMGGSLKGINEEFHDDYRANRARKCKKEYERSYQRSMKGKNYIKTIYPPCGILVKFVVKIQAFPKQKSQFPFLLCYDKSREYMVKIFKRKQTKKYKKLYNVVVHVEQGIDTNDAKKGYFYAFVDKKKRLHLFVAEMVAAQPW